MHCTSSFVLQCHRTALQAQELKPQPTPCRIWSTNHWRTIDAEEGGLFFQFIADTKSKMTQVLKPCSAGQRSLGWVFTVPRPCEGKRLWLMDFMWSLWRGPEWSNTHHATIHWLQLWFRCWWSSNDFDSPDFALVTHPVK